MDWTGIHQTLQTSWYGNTLENWALSLLSALLTIALLPLLRKSVTRRVHARPISTAGAALARRLVQRTTLIFFIVIGIYISTRSLQLGPSTSRVLDIGTLVTVWFQVGLWVSAIAVHVLQDQLQRRGAHHLVLASAFGVVSFLVQAVVWMVAIALALANAGVNIVTLIAGLGVGGAAIALAARAVLSNFFASASINLDKMFAVGDALVIGDMVGKVEEIGNRSTRIRSINGEQLIIPNADLLKNRLRNFGRIAERREVLRLRLARGNSRAHIEQAMHIVSEAVRQQQHSRLDRCHFATIAQDAFVIEAVYFVRDGTLASLAAARDEIDDFINARFLVEGIEIETSAQTLHVALT